MENSPWLKLITIGLVLAALAVGYFLLTGRLSSNSVTRTKSSPSPSVLGQNAQSSPAPATTPSPSPSSAYERIVDRSQGGVQTLPKTGFPVELAVVFSISAIVSGLSLRKFPH